MVDDVLTNDGGGNVEVSRHEDGHILVSWMNNDGVSFRWWKLTDKQAYNFATMIANEVDMDKIGIKK